MRGKSRGPERSFAGHLERRGGGEAEENIVIAATRGTRKLAQFPLPGLSGQNCSYLILTETDATCQ